MKRIIIISALFMSCFTAKAQVFTSIAPSGQMLYFELNGTEATMTYPPANTGDAYWDGYSKPTGRLIIPDSVLYYGTRIAVTRIGNYALANCGDITSICISEGVRSIGSGVYDFDTSLISITFPASADTIGSFYLGMCESHLDTVSFLNSVPPVGAGSFMRQVRNIEGIGNQYHYPNSIFIPCGTYDSYDAIYHSIYPYVSQSNLFEPLVTDLDVNVMANNSNRGGVTIIQQRDHDIYCDSSCVISATANVGYRFMFWSNGRTNNPDTLFVDRDTSVTAIFSNVPDPQICMVSVQNGLNCIVWNKEEPCDKYIVYREGLVSGEYDPIAIVPYDSVSVYTDSTSRPTSRSYRYRISALDEDGVEGVISPLHKTMHLSINQGLGGRWNLSWTPYEGAEYTTYIIYRGTNASDLQQIDIMPADGNTSYSDETAPEGDVYYQVGIVMSSPCSGSTETAMGAKSSSISLSNIATNSPVGISEVFGIDGIKVFSKNKRILIDGLNGQDVTIYTIDGRTIASLPKATEHVAIPVTNTGVNVVKIGNHPARKVVVII